MIDRLSGKYLPKPVENLSGREGRLVPALSSGARQGKMETFTPQILHFPSLPSTNLETARRAGEGAAEGLCVIAGEQTAGRGRLRRQWVSPKDAGLYFSIVLRPQFEPSTASRCVRARAW